MHKFWISFNYVVVKMSEKEIVHEMLRRALDADERDDKVHAVVYYSNAVELILKVGDPMLREKLNKYAVQALERAEELRGISPTHKPAIGNSASPTPARNVTSTAPGWFLKLANGRK